MVISKIGFIMARYSLKSEQPRSFFFRSFPTLNLNQIWETAYGIYTKIRLWTYTNQASLWINTAENWSRLTETTTKTSPPICVKQPHKTSSNHNVFLVEHQLYFYLYHYKQVSNIMYYHSESDIPPTYNFTRQFTGQSFFEMCRNTFSNTSTCNFKICK